MWIVKQKIENKRKLFLKNAIPKFVYNIGSSLDLIMPLSLLIFIVIKNKNIQHL